MLHHALLLDGGCVHVLLRFQRRVVDPIAGLLGVAWVDEVVTDQRPVRAGDLKPLSPDLIVTAIERRDALMGKPHQATKVEIDSIKETGCGQDTLW